jgi:hypothetical protein
MVRCPLLLQLRILLPRPLLQLRLRSLLPWLGFLPQLLWLRLLLLWLRPLLLRPLLARLLLLRPPLPCCRLLRTSFRPTSSRRSLGRHMLFRMRWMAS